ncbi:MAG: hypothetical protein K0S40_3288 [Actinomycetospora sp.]|nr:hypothetical protein [Actinomycetospora sp.]
MVSRLRRFVRRPGQVAATIRPFAPAIRDGKVRPVGIDPEGGREYRMVSELSSVLAFGDDEHLVTAVAVEPARGIEPRTFRLQGECSAD